MKERVATFGPNAGLVGVVTIPDTGVKQRAVLMANVGTHHRVGPCRLYVELARALAAKGWHVLRFDLSGMGDSAARAGKGTDLEHAVLDVADAMEHIEKSYGIYEFVLLGLCSGVDCMHVVAVNDARVVGAVFIDGYTYPTPAFVWRRYVGRLIHIGRWKRSFSRRLAHIASKADDRSGDGVDVFNREYPSRTQFRADIARIAARGARMLFLFTGSVDYRFNDARQIYEQLGNDPAGALVDVEYFASIDHLFSSQAKRATLLQRLLPWMDANESTAHTLRAPSIESERVLPGVSSGASL